MDFLKEDEHVSQAYDEVFENSFKKSKNDHEKSIKAEAKRRDDLIKD